MPRDWLHVNVYMCGQQDAATRDLVTQSTKFRKR